MKPVPEEFEASVSKASNMIAEAAKLVMFIAEMLGNDTYELDTAEGYNIIIKKRSSNDGQSGEDRQ